MTERELTDEQRRAHEKHLAATYSARRLIRDLGGAVLIPLALLFVSPRWAAYSLVPCGIAFIALLRLTLRRQSGIPWLKPRSVFRR
jgi:hypothetical protein